MKYLVTGGAGFIGSTLVNSLIEKGNKVVCIDNESGKDRNTPRWNKGADNYKIDICEYDQIKELFKDVDFVFHMAAEVSVEKSIHNPIETFEKNILGTVNILQCSKEYNVKRVVFSSTSAIYGNNSVPNSELQKDDPLNPYSVSKLAAEKICKMYTDLYGLETIIFRYFNVYGEGQPENGPYAPVMGIFSKQKESGKPLTIVGDGSQKRDFINVNDIVKANILAAISEIDSYHFGSIFNVGSGKNYSIKEIANMISNNYSFIPNRSGEVAETLADVELLKNTLNWSPEIDLKSWIKENI
jgi:UDP-glucose 4-epimerase